MARGGDVAEPARLRRALQGIRGGNTDALDAHSRSRFAFLAVGTPGDGRVANCAEHFVALNERAKGGVFAVEKFRLRKTDEELAPGRIGIIRASHRDNSAHVRPAAEFGLDLVARTAGAPVARHLRVFGQRIAPLNHKVFDDTVKRRAVVKALTCEFLEILDGIAST